MTEFDNLRELNAYAIDIARDYFAMAANDPRREENRQGNTETEPAAVLNGAGGFGVAPTSTQNSVAEEKRKQNRVIMRRQWSATSEVFSSTMNGRRLLPNLPVRELGASSP